MKGSPNKRGSYKNSRPCSSKVECAYPWKKICSKRVTGSFTCSWAISFKDYDWEQIVRSYRNGSL